MPAPVPRRLVERGTLLDILLIDALGQLNFEETAHSARRVFEARATHAFPPAFAMPPEWVPEFESLALELGSRYRRGRP